MKVRMMVFLVVLLAVSTTAHAAGRSVPNVLAYQSMLYDDGGNPIEDGEADVTFRITNPNGDVLFEENQRLEVVRGAVSALIGNGLTEDGAPIGGVPFGVLDPSDVRFLEVEVNGYPPAGPMEIASVPYAVYAEEANSVAIGAVNTNSIADGSIAYEDLSDDMISQLANRLSSENGFMLRGDLDKPAAASTIGVKRQFNYSGSSELQGVLTDMDRAIMRREERIRAEADTRKASDSSLDSKISDEVINRQSADAALRLDIENEIVQLGDTVTNNVASHDHGEKGQGGFLYPAAIWFDSGVRNHNDAVDLHQDYSSTDCKVMVAASKASVTTGGIMSLDVGYQWSGNKSFVIECLVATYGPTCTASYFVMCTKGM